MLCTHAFSLLLFASVGLVHLLARPKDSNWLRILAAALAALGLFALTSLLLGTGANRNSVPNPATFWEIMGAWLAIVGNGSAVLLVITALGWLGYRRWRIPTLPMLLAMLLIFTALVGATSNLVSVGRTRYFLTGLPLGIVILAAGIYCWHRQRKLASWLLLGAWLLSAWLFAQNTDWDDLLGGRDKAYQAPPWHIISREARMATPAPNLLIFKPANKILNNGQQIKFSMNHYYFARHGIQVRQILAIRYLADTVDDLALRAPLVWLVTQRSSSSGEDEPVNALMRARGFVFCGEKSFVADTTVSEWTWRDLQCAPPQTVASFDNSALTYNFYGASVDETLRLRYHWVAQGDTAQDWRISHQLLDEDWANVAQLDLPLAHAGELRQYVIDISNVPAGDYRLMAVVYDARTGERQVWRDNEDWIPEMQQLAEITIPKQATTSP